MDSIKKIDDYGMAAWKLMFGGDNLFGRLKIYIFLAGFVVVGGCTLAQLA